MRRWTSLAAGLAVLLAALAVRLPAVTAGLPYMTYVDEGHVIHHASYLLERGTWEPDTYSYPTFPFYLVAGAALAYSPVYAAVHGRSLRQDLSPSPFRYYDVVEPTELLVLARLVTLAFSLGIVAVTGLLVRRLAGPRAGLMSAWLAALAPALVMRSSVVNINPIMACFAVAALYFAEGARSGSHPRRDALLAGAMAGFAGATKYPAALVCLPVALAVLLAPSPWIEKLRRLVLAGSAAVAVVLLAMPALFLRTRAVLDGLRAMSLIYGREEQGSYWEQAVRRAEWSLPVNHPELGLIFLLLAAAGLAVGLRDRRASPAALGWLLFGAATGLLVSQYKFRAFRNLLALVPLACALIGLLYAWLRERVSRPALLDGAFALLPVLLFFPALREYTGYQLALEDSREQAVRLLAKHVRPADRVLVSEELAVLPCRLRALPARVEARPWTDSRPRIAQAEPDYILLGDLVQRDGRSKINPALRRKILARYEVLAQHGDYGTAPGSGWFRGNHQRVFVLKRRGAARRSAVPSP
ncbi:MAG: ArnT family glycosyltransferase, partial [Thermoanaerobaculia bacterium]